MTASTRRELRSAATSTSTTAIGLIRALTDARPIKPTSTRCLSARRPNPAEAPLIDAEILFRQPQPPHILCHVRHNECLAFLSPHQLFEVSGQHRCCLVTRLKVLSITTRIEVLTTVWASDSIVHYDFLFV